VAVAQRSAFGVKFFINLYQVATGLKGSGPDIRINLRLFHATRSTKYVE
jgi:hypothetical protein